MFQKVKFQKFLQPWWSNDWQDVAKSSQSQAFQKVKFKNVLQPWWSNDPQKVEMVRWWGDLTSCVTPLKECTCTYNMIPQNKSILISSLGWVAGWFVLKECTCTYCMIFPNFKFSSTLVKQLSESNKNETILSVSDY